MVKTQCFFAGSNSGRGFYSLFDNIIEPGARRIYLLKGGPGTGKSSFMRHIADSVGKQGYDRELFYCSSDPRALDAVSFPALGIALIDATAPHVLDAELPGCRDQILPLGEFWSMDALEEKRDEIVQGGHRKQALFAEAFRYFSAALTLEENISATGSERKGDGAFLERVEEILQLLDQKRSHGGSRPGTVRHLFASALTPEGYVSHIQSLIEGYSHIFILPGGPGTDASEFLSNLASGSQARGHDLVAFHYPLDPHQLLHLMIPEAQIAVLSDTFLESFPELVGTRISLKSPPASDNEGDYKIWTELLQKGFDALRQAQLSHIHIEEYYSQAMDFAALDAYRDKVLADILS